MPDFRFSRIRRENDNGTNQYTTTPAGDAAAPACQGDHCWRLFSLSSLFSSAVLGRGQPWHLLDSAAQAPGRVTVASNRKTVQHLEGGIVKELLVKEGDAVAEDQVLIQLDDTQSRARLELLRGRYDKLLATEARLEAEQAFAAGIKFPASLTSRRNQPQVAKILNAEKALFEARRRSVEGRIQIFHKRIAQLKKEISGLEAQIAAEDEQLALIEDERASFEILFKKGIRGQSAAAGTEAGGGQTAGGPR